MLIVEVFCIFGTCLHQPTIRGTPQGNILRHRPQRWLRMEPNHDAQSRQNTRNQQPHRRIPTSNAKDGSSNHHRNPAPYLFNEHQTRQHIQKCSGANHTARSDGVQCRHYRQILRPGTTAHEAYGNHRKLTRINSRIFKFSSSEAHYPRPAGNIQQKWLVSSVQRVSHALPAQPCRLPLSQDIQTEGLHSRAGDTV